MERSTVTGALMCRACVRIRNTRAAPRARVSQYTGIGDYIQLFCFWSTSCQLRSEIYRADAFLALTVYLTAPKTEQHMKGCNGARI